MIRRLHRLRRLLHKVDCDLGAKGVHIKGTVSDPRRRGLTAERNLCNLRNLWIITLLRNQWIQSDSISVHPELSLQLEAPL